MKLIAHLTGLRPRGWSEAAPALLGAALAPLCTLFAAICWLWETGFALSRGQLNRAHPKTKTCPARARSCYIQIRSPLSQG